ncbi:MAG: hypothetical protein ACREFS_10870, partial [Acetobacteraceae bacterium]
MKGTISNATPKIFSSFLFEPAVGADVVRPAAKRPTDHLLAEKLALEWPEPDDVAHGVAVPAFRQHANGDNATHVASGRRERPAELCRELREALRVNRAALPVLGPLLAPDGIQR